MFLHFGSLIRCWCINLAMNITLAMFSQATIQRSLQDDKLEGFQLRRFMIMEVSDPSYSQSFGKDDNEEYPCYGAVTIIRSSINEPKEKVQRLIPPLLLY